MSPNLLAGLIAAGAALAALLFWPGLGLWARWRRQRHNRHQARAEDALKHLHASAQRGQAATLLSLAGALRLSQRAAIRLVEQLESLGWVVSRADGLRLTGEGERRAIEVIRAHRLWERYLADEARMPLTAIHAEAERREHNRPAGAVQALDAALGHPVTDPHGDPIPTGEGRLAQAPDRPLADWPLHTPARIVHLEDEPDTLYSQIVAEGLRPGQVVQVVEASGSRLALSDGEKEYSLSPLAAANVFVTPAKPAQPHEPAHTLADLKRGQQAAVRRLDDSLQGFTRRRLLDLGLTPGATVAAEMNSLFGDPMAYRVRGALIALRRDQARSVIVGEIKGIEG